uniref:Uncharacterized protein n=1 Tax=Ditylenchus dipsaci TaxID=166011 RepID=A0A915DSN8_9BILA
MLLCTKSSYFSAKKHRAEHAKHLFNIKLAELYADDNLDQGPGLRCMAAGLIKAEQISTYDLAATISVGTPPQRSFNVMLDLQSLSQDDVFGYVGSDYLQFGQLTINASFALLQSVTWNMLTYPIDGELGLSWFENPNNISFINQIVDQLDEPIISLQSDRSLIYNNGTAHVTIGELDIKNCEDNWMFAPCNPELYSYERF